MSVCEHVRVDSKVYQKLLTLKYLSGIVAMKNVIKINQSVMSMAHMSPLWMNRASYL